MNTAKSPALLWVKGHKKTIVIISLVVIGLWTALDLSPLGGNIRFYAKWIECGQRPVVSGFSYKSPAYYTEAPAFIELSPRMFCSPKEAELAGYSANKHQYEFRHTTPEERRESRKIREEEDKRNRL